MSVKLPIAEVFHSLQGEGTWIGAPMFFVRLAGCSVGDKKAFGPGVPPLCRTYAGEMRCDTDYSRTMMMEPETIVRQCKYPRMCITGGEPCDHKLRDLIDISRAAGIRVHIETSGTVYQEWLRDVYWIACSPKQGATVTVLRLAHELRFLYDPKWEDPTEKIESHIRVAEHVRPEGRPKPDVFISPVNEVGRVHRYNLLKTISYLDKHPQWRLSPQLHKFLKIK